MERRDNVAAPEPPIRLRLKRGWYGIFLPMNIDQRTMNTEQSSRCRSLVRRLGTQASLPQLLTKIKSRLLKAGCTCMVGGLYAENIRYL